MEKTPNPDWFRLGWDAYFAGTPLSASLDLDVDDDLYAAFWYSGWLKARDRDRASRAASPARRGGFIAAANGDPGGAHP